MLTVYSKNRRDGATVSTRVLSLADRCGRELFETATVTTGLESLDQDDDKVQSRKRRRPTAINTRSHL